MEEWKKYSSKRYRQTEIDPHVVDIIKNAIAVIDVGCGYNPYKKFHNNLIGVDIINDKADIVCDILDFSAEEKFDVAICYGSLHFNSYEWVRERLEWVINNTTDNAQILIKVNPSSHRMPPRFDRWNPGLAEHFAEIYNLKVRNWREWRSPIDNTLRYKFDYKKVEREL